MRNTANCNEKFKDVGKIIGCILLYYPFSIGITFYQQWFIRDFHFPLFVVFSHYVIKFLAAATFRKFDLIYCHRTRTTLQWHDYLFKVAITGIAASVDIGLSNWSFQYITVSLYTMAKSSCIIFILVFAVIFSLERCKWSVVGVVVLIAFGLVLFTYQSTQFNLFGFMLVEIAAFCSGIRWASCQMLLQRKENGLQSPIDLIFHIQPWMILSIIPLMFYFEASLLAELDIRKLLSVAHLILIGGLLGLFMELAEFLLIYYTSSLTLNVCGIAKELITLTLAHFLKNDVLSKINCVGLFICLCGIILHVVVKSRRGDDDPSHDDVDNLCKLKSTSNDAFDLTQRLLGDDESSEDECRNRSPTSSKRTN